MRSVLSARLLALLLVLASLGPADAPPPLATRAWPVGPLEVRVGFDRPAPEKLASAIVGGTIPFAVDEPKAKGPAEPVGRLRIAAARLVDDGRTLVLATDPHPFPARYALTLPAVSTGDPATSTASQT